VSAAAAAAAAVNTNPFEKGKQHQAFRIISLRSGSINNITFCDLS
jgi:hypothetical protein